MKEIDLSKIKSGKEFEQIVNSSKDNCFLLYGEENNALLNQINEVELTPKFNIGDKVCFNKDFLEFNGVDDNYSVFFVVGFEIVEDQYLYHVNNENGRYSFFGFELDKFYN